MLRSTRSRKGKKLINRPFEARIDGSRRGIFEDVCDAITSAQIAQLEHPFAARGFSSSSCIAGTDVNCNPVPGSNCALHREADAAIPKEPGMQALPTG
jgi:hypothetical protein